MIPIKIECGCGQHYAFDVEPVGGRMPAAVACPVCGADGTDTANTIIASQLPQPPPFAPKPPAPLARPRMQVQIPHPEQPVLAVPAGVRRVGSTLGLVNRETAESEARAKISWGDAQDEVIRYLMLQGFTAAEAKDLVAVLMKERVAALRVKGIRKIVFGSVLMCVPIGAWGGLRHLPILPVRLMAVAIMVGLWGAWELINGILLLVAPRMEHGDVGSE